MGCIYNIEKIRHRAFILKITLKRIGYFARYIIPKNCQIYITAILEYTFSPAAKNNGFVNF